MSEYLDVKFIKKFDGFSLDIEWFMGNELAVLFGYSGAGKSLTLDAIAGLMEPDAGSIRCGDETFLDTAKGISLPTRKRNIGYVFQQGALFPHMTVRGNITYALPRDASTEERQGIEEIMETLGIGYLATRYPRDISGGQAQRVAIARALVRRPKLLLLDEPFAALDRPIRLQMHSLLLDVRRKFNIPAVMVTHDIDEARTLADRLLVYSNGRVIQSGSPEHVICRPLTSEVRDLLCPERIESTLHFN